MVKIGLEIHQQLDTGKLFCGCPSNISDAEPPLKVRRRLRIAQGELGEVDRAAAHEVSKQKEFIYHFYPEYNCLVELDEEPPHPINQSALNYVLSLAQILKARVLPRIAVMRKTVLDGSNTSGFQRTALVAVNGILKIEGLKIRIPTICIEEEAAKIVERTSDYDVYNLTRLGIPLVEITTEPVIKSGEECRRVAEHIGMVLRSLPGLKRGIGSIRQDVNVSVEGGARVEIKGAQDLRALEQLVENEISRQNAILQLIKKFPKLDKQPEIVDLSSVFKGTASHVLKKAMESNGRVMGIKLAGFAGLLGYQLLPNKRLGTELSDYGKVKAGISGLFHSDELPNYGITRDEVAQVREHLGCNSGDAFVLIAAEENKAKRGLSSVFERLVELSKGVPSEVRNANPDSTSSYLRPMPGRSRMYPETDLPLIIPKITKATPTKLLHERAKEFTQLYSLSSDLANLLVRSPKCDFVRGLFERFDRLKPSFIAETVLTAEKKILKELNKEVKIPDSAYEIVLGALNTGQIPKESVLTLLAESQKGDIKERIKGLSCVESCELEGLVEETIRQNPGASFNALMGIVMEKVRGKASGSAVAEMLKRKLK